jgi:hypothetical protein
MADGKKAGLQSTEESLARMTPARLRPRQQVRLGAFDFHHIFHWTLAPSIARPIMRAVGSCLEPHCVGHFIPACEHRRRYDHE